MKQTDSSYLEMAKEIIHCFPHLSDEHTELISNLIEATQNGDLFLSITDQKSITNFENRFPFYLESIGKESRLFFQKTYKEKRQFEKNINALVSNLSNEEIKAQKKTTEIESIISHLETNFQNPLAREQKQAVIESATSSFRIVAGGPGTGKTTVVSFILKVLDEIKSLPNPKRIALVAPTGRAAQRLTESIQKNLSFFPNTKELVSSLRGQTIHNLLKIFPNITKPYYGEKRYLPYDLIIMDETSMVDIEVMNLLLQSIGETTKLILLGDPNQLPSVGQGEVLSDLLIEFKKQGKFVSELKTNHRSSNTSKFSQFAELVKNSFDHPDRKENFPNPDVLEYNQIADEADFIWLQKEKSNKEDDVSFKDWKQNDLIHFLWTDFFLQTAVKSTALDWKKEDLTLKQNKEILDGLISEYRCLTILRNGFFGIESIHNRILDLAKKHLTSFHSNSQKIEYRHLAKSFYFEGMPIIIKRNDQVRKLFNGDIGLVLKIDSELRAVFPIENRLYSFALDTLPEHEPAFFLTIHKSQGSEYNTILLYLPPISSYQSEDLNEIPILNRRILYTAITRAKKKVILMGDHSTWNLGLETFRKRNTGFTLT
ncbi:exodeoxyribonuclease V subunit alpha [Leptospira bourretii]|uniref:RecBCD enzyme subunit RecD n=1 Tax=Leptospira bourretii TaxID=2484962 RepID=A0A4R9IGV0_9LEPT|nr:exodeoxyribonuclease V subunit alpha [Leptospira bourretii]TGK87266.1 exodeoxyribonuclease V subunit alpha [Leptospira bourretii]TGK87642.1 exodeoxyribonuclease V subunit alpha [Leptospira bourretii]TGL38089.1 exodeoxyribonuclease V subunit alpha [Leptospira bourretii]